MRRPYKLAVQKHSVINLCSITGFAFDSISKVLIYLYFSLFDLLYFTMPLTDRFRDPHADVCQNWISLCFTVLIITLLIIIRVGNKTYNNKNPSSAGIEHWAQWGMSVIMQNCVIRFPTRFEYFSFFCLSCSLQPPLPFQPLWVINHTAAMVLVWSLVSLLFPFRQSC